MKKNESLTLVRKAKSLLSQAYYILVASVLITACSLAAKEVNLENKDIEGTVTGPVAICEHRKQVFVFEASAFIFLPASVPIKSL